MSNRCNLSVLFTSLRHLPHSYFLNRRFHPTRVFVSSMFLIGSGRVVNPYVSLSSPRRSWRSGRKCNEGRLGWGSRVTDSPRPFRQLGTGTRCPSQRHTTDVFVRSRISRQISRMSSSTLPCLHSQVGSFRGVLLSLRGYPYLRLGDCRTSVSIHRHLLSRVSLFTTSPFFFGNLSVTGTFTQRFSVPTHIVLTMGCSTIVPLTVFLVTRLSDLWLKNWTGSV